jgi:arylsulfatase
VDGRWELFDVVNDFAETRDLSDQYPELVASLIEEWDEYMARVGGVEPLRPRGFW